MNIQNPEVKRNLILRLHRITGQLHGIENMLESERDCREIMQQFSAVHSSVESASRIFLQEYATSCLSNFYSDSSKISGEDLNQKQEKLIQEMITMLEKTP